MNNKDMKKEIIFFDADGTLWYPKKTKFGEKPWWIYFDEKTASDDPLEHLTLMPNVRNTLKRLKSMGLVLVLVSQLPFPEKIANEQLRRLTTHFGIYEFFDQIRASHSSITKGIPDPKHFAILEVLRERKIPKSRALMVGDSYTFDYLMARRDAKIDCVLINGFKYTKELKEYNRVQRKIDNLDKIFGYLS